MTLAKWKKNDDLFPSFFDDFFANDVLSGIVKGTTVPAINISEEEDRFEVEVAAPGLKKEDFKIDLDHHTLTISAEKKEEKEEKKNKNFTRREFSFTSFQRSFTLPESVDAGKIEASYKDGVLCLTLPKREESRKQPSRKIEVK